MRSRKTAAVVSFFCSILLHLFLLVVIKNHKDERSEFSQHEKPISVILQPPKKEKRDSVANSRRNAKSVKTQIIHHTPQLFDKRPKDTRFLSKSNNWNARQTIAKKNGAYRDAGQGLREGLLREKTVNKKQSNKDLKSESGQFVLTDRGHLKLEERKKTEVSDSAAVQGLENGRDEQAGLAHSNDFIEDVSIGDFNRLNTQEFRFYGFYFRIRKRLEQFWGKSIQEKAHYLFQSGRQLASGKNHVTSLLVYLDAQGKIKKILVKSTSGVRELDNAAVQSFNKAGPFPHPPRAMVRNGLAKIEWGFVVKS